MEVRPGAWVFTKNVALLDSFLREVLGFTGYTETVGIDGQPGVVILERDGFEVTVFGAMNVSGDYVQRAVITFLVEDLEPIADVLDRRGVRYHWESNVGQRPSITFLDPAELRAFALEEKR